MNFLERIAPGQRKFSSRFPLMRTVRVNMHTCLTKMETKYAALTFETSERNRTTAPHPHPSRDVVNVPPGAQMKQLCLQVSLV